MAIVDVAIVVVIDAIGGNFLGIAIYGSEKVIREDEVFIMDDVEGAFACDGEFFPDEIGF